MVNDLNKPRNKKRQRHSLYMQICVNIDKESSCQQIGPAGQGLEMIEFFLSNEIKKSITSRIFSGYVSVNCSFLVNTISLVTLGENNTNCRATSEKMDTL